MNLHLIVKRIANVKKKKKKFPSHAKPTPRDVPQVIGRIPYLQGRRRFLKSSTFIVRHRRSTRAVGMSRGGGGGGESTRVGSAPIRRGVRGISPKKIVLIYMKDVCM